MATKVIIGEDGKPHRVEIGDDGILKSLGIEAETAAQKSERLYRERKALYDKVDEATRQVHIQVLANKLENVKAELARKKAEEAAMPEPEFYLDDALMREGRYRRKHGSR
jgi:hypothetical protein